MKSYFLLAFCLSTVNFSFATVAGCPILKKVEKKRNLEIREIIRQSKGEYAFQNYLNDASIDENHKLIKKYCLTDEEVVAISLRTSEKLKQLQPFIDVLNSALNKLPNYEGDVFRQTNLNEKLLKLHKVGKVVTYTAFTSTYNKRRFAPNERNKVAIYIESFTGKEIPHVSNYKTAESEVLFKSDTKFQITKRLDQSDGTTILFMKERK